MSRLQAVPTSQQPQGSNYRQLDTYFDERYQIAWGYMHSEPRPCFTPELLGELLSWAQYLKQQMDDPSRPEVSYLVMASQHPGVFNLGGDLHLFRKLIMCKDKIGLFEYGKLCVDACYSNATHLDRPKLTTISLVQGDALGGGFECALSGNVLIAERGSKMGFPEILFNLFPGMGALTLLGRRIGLNKAEKIILSGNLYLAEELYEMGVVDVLAEPGDGVQAVYDYVRRCERSRNGSLALRAAKELIAPVSYQELLGITEIWVDAALRIEPKDLRMMERLIARQGGKLETAAAGSAAEGIRLAG